MVAAAADWMIDKSHWPSNHQSKLRELVANELHAASADARVVTMVQVRATTGSRERVQARGYLFLVS